MFHLRVCLAIHDQYILLPDRNSRLVTRCILLWTLADLCVFPTIQKTAVFVVSEGRRSDIDVRKFIRRVILYRPRGLLIPPETSRDLAFSDAFPTATPSLFAELLAHCDRSERRRIQIARSLSANNVTRGTHLTGEALTTPGICGEPERAAGHEHERSECSYQNGSVWSSLA